jgi:methionyl-tRNA formyltransferase
MFSGVQVKLWRAEPIAETTAGRPGEVLAANAQDGVLIACGGGVLRLIELQKPGGKRLPAKEFIKGFPLEEGTFSSGSK